MGTKKHPTKERLVVIAIPTEIHRAAKIQAAREGITLKQHVIRCMSQATDPVSHAMAYDSGSRDDG